MGEEWEREPVDPFAGRERLDLFTPDPHDMRKTPCAPAFSPSGAAEAEAEKTSAKSPVEDAKSKEIYEREPIDPFAGRKRLDLFIPDLHEMWRLPGDELHCARPGGEPVFERSLRKEKAPQDKPDTPAGGHEDEKRPASPKPISQKEEAPQSVRDTTTDAKRPELQRREPAPDQTERPKGLPEEPPQDYEDALESVGEEERPFVESVIPSNLGPKSPLPELALAAMLGQDGKTRERALLWAVLRVIETKGSVKTLERTLAPILETARAARRMGAGLAVPVPLEYALSMRRELDRLGVSLEIRFEDERERDEISRKAKRNEMRGKPAASGEDLYFIGVGTDGRLEVGGRKTKSRRARNAYMAERTRLWRARQKAEL